MLQAASRAISSVETQQQVAQHPCNTESTEFSEQLRAKEQTIISSDTHFAGG